nr:hypothetical protein [Tanacetum cinerariifolium]
PDYVPGPEHADDEIVAEDQPYVEDASPTAQSPEYVPESDVEAHPEDDDDEDPKEDPVDYPTDGGDDGDDKEGSSEDDKDDDMDIEADDDEEEEHPAPTDSDELLAMSSPPASPLSPWSLPPPRIPFPPLPLTLSPPSLVLSPAPPPSPIHSLSYRAAMIRLRAEAASTSHYLPLPPLLLPISASTSSPPLQPPLLLAGRIDPREIMRDPKREIGYGITDSWGKIVEAIQGAQVSTDTELGGYMREFETRVRQDTNEIYMRRAHAYIRHLMETEARMSREAWVRSTYASDLVRGEVMSLRTTVLGQMTEIRKLYAADRRRQTVISEMLRADHR